MTPTNDNPQRRVAPIDLTPEQFRELGHRLVDDLAAFMESLPTRPVAKSATPSEIRDLLPGDDLPANGTDPAQLLSETASMLFDRSLFNGHPRFFGYITAGPSPIGALGDLLGAVVNPNLGGWQLSPIASEIEIQTTRWIAQMIGFPADSGGIFVSGGNMANFICFLAARRAKAGERIRTRGLAEHVGRLVVYSSKETHTWIQKALDLFGHGTACSREVPVDDDLRADLHALADMIKKDRRAGDRPFMLVGTAGTVSTGAVDPLPEMAEIAKANDMWFHVDGAYGALAAVLDDPDPAFKGIAQADSVAVDPHKWLYAPLEAGCALVRDSQSLIDAFSYRPPYYHFDGEAEPETNFYEYGMQNSRGFRALKVWLSLRQVGRAGYAQMIDEDCKLAASLYAHAKADALLEAWTLGLSIATFRYVPEDLQPGEDKVDEYLNVLNEDILTRLKHSGELFLSNAVVRGVFLLRACVVNFRTSQADIDAIPEIVKRHGQEADAALRSQHL